MIAGDVAGHTGPGSTYTPMTMIHATIAPGAAVRLPWRRDFNALVYVLSGDGHGRRRAASGAHRPGRALRAGRHDHGGREPDARSPGWPAWT